MYYDKDASPIELMEWVKLFEDASYKLVARDVVAGVEVSTVWLGLDHGFSGGPPVIFETMVFGGDEDQYQQRYHTLAEAQDGHRRTVRMLQMGETLAR